MDCVVRFLDVLAFDSSRYVAKLGSGSKLRVQARNFVAEINDSRHLRLSFFQHQSYLSPVEILADGVDLLLPMCEHVGNWLNAVPRMYLDLPQQVGRADAGMKKNRVVGGQPSAPGISK